MLELPFGKTIIVDSMLVTGLRILNDGGTTMNEWLRTVIMIFRSISLGPTSSEMLPDNERVCAQALLPKRVIKASNEVNSNARVMFWLVLL
jgi:hypothetical protein